MFRPFDGHLGIYGRLGAGGDDHIFRLEFCETIAVFDADAVGIRKAADAVDHLDAVAHQLILRDSNFVFHHVLDAKIQVRHGHVFFYVVVRPVEILVVEAGEMQHRFAHSLAGDGAGVDAHPADGGLLFDDGDSFSRLRALNGGALSARAGTNHNQIIRLHLRSPVLWCRPRGLMSRL